VGGAVAGGSVESDASVDGSPQAVRAAANASGATNEMTVETVRRPVAWLNMPDWTPLRRDRFPVATR
jgi:hypothetical protein